MKKSLYFNRRSVLKGTAATAVAAASIGMPSIVNAEAKSLVFASSFPLTGPFAAAGSIGLKDYLDWIEMTNASGGVAGRKIIAKYEDSGYVPSKSLANFKKAMSADQKPVFYGGDSTGFMKLVAPELQRTPVLCGGTSFSNELANPQTHPYQFIAGPTYNSMFDILLQYIKAKGGKRIAFVYSDTEFGRDPISHGESAAKKLGLDVVHKEITKPAGAEVMTHVSALRRANPDFAILHGYVTGVWPQIIGGARKAKMNTQFLGTFWGMEKVIADGVTKQAGPFLEGYAGVTPYRYFYEAKEAPAYGKFFAFKKSKYGDKFPGYCTTWSVQIMFNYELAKLAIEKTIKAGKQLTAKNTVKALESIKDWDSGGYMGKPVSIINHAIPQGRIYSYKASNGLFLPVSDWITV
tara:strand:- start:2649 stop:3869 length:1221 start_codon:yes stop_codon:yes gene_type:complete